jgi:hypothetical protein
MQVTFRLKDDDIARVQRLAPRFALTKYELHRRLFYVGLAQVEQGVDLFNPAAASRVEMLLSEVRTLLELARARDFNLASDALESRIRLRTLGEVLAPESDGLVDERVVAVLPQFLASLEDLPPEAPPAKAR